MKRFGIIILALSLNVLPSWGQQRDTTKLAVDPVLAELDSILNSPDSLSFISLIDSILTSLPDIRSQLAVRVGYSSNTAASTSGININQFGLSPGISYYHKSGAYADVATYYGKNYDPNVYLTTATVGYIGMITKRWSISGEYDHFFYGKPSTEVTSTPTQPLTFTTFTNDLYLSNMVRLWKFNLRFDYTFLFGGNTAHRFAPGVSLMLKKKKCLGLDYVAFYPGATMYYGSMVTLIQVPNWTRPLEFIQLYRQGKPLFHEEEQVDWGVSYYSLSLPLSVTYKNWSLLVGYNYSVTGKLLKDNQGIPNNGYLIASLTRYFDL